MSMKDSVHMCYRVVCDCVFLCSFAIHTVTYSASVKHTVKLYIQ